MWELWVKQPAIDKLKEKFNEDKLIHSKSYHNFYLNYCCPLAVFATAEHPPLRGTICRELKWPPAGVVVRRGGYQLRCRTRHLTAVQNFEVRRQKSSNR
ncbi:hypothetical protein TNCV_4720791 [Trichonephila clavipes]|uniref:Uncharacterized protein n=1 Tax=Trichonephila clavipes TaxID=2585209 RepID=A0A8X7BEL3_TRICX|nr:hypothetical protein TNCV_4720791 [Trichonephila clavipes]